MSTRTRQHENAAPALAQQPAQQCRQTAHNPWPRREIPLRVAKENFHLKHNSHCKTSVRPARSTREDFAIWKHGLLVYALVKLMALCESIAGTVDFAEKVGQGVDLLVKLF